MGRSFRRNRRVLMERCPGGRRLRTASRGHWWLHGGAKFRWRVAPEAASFAMRRAVCCVGAEPAGRCGRFSCFAHAPLIKKSGQKRNHGLLWPALPSGRSVSGTCASAALRAVSVGGRGKKFSFVCLGKRFGGELWELGLWSLCCAVGPCRAVAPKGGPVFRDRNGRCGLLQSSHLGGFAARCALRAALRRARGRPPFSERPRACGSQDLSFGRLFFPFGV